MNTQEEISNAPSFTYPVPIRFKKSKPKTTDEDDPLVRVAVNESLIPSDQSKDDGMETETAPRVTIDDMIGKLQSRNVVEMPTFDDPDGDTLIYIDAAQQQPEQNQLDYEAYVEQCAMPFRLKKEAVMKLNSPIINIAFEPGAQYRILRRRKLVNKLAPGIKYVLDLTAPGEGDDAALLLSSLSCSEGLRRWHHAHKIWGVSNKLVCGKEEYVSEGLNPQFASNGVLVPSRCPEYSPVRHRAAIERLLAIAVGRDPKLDSATKIWTTFAVAKYFGIVDSPLTDYIVTWLRVYPNSIFSEVLTEASHIMADHLQVSALARDTFAMLVGEEALDSMVRNRDPHRSPSLSTFGRKKEDLPEKIKTRVEYASKKFADRIVADFEDLKEGSWIQRLPEFERLSSFTHPELQKTISLLQKSLIDCIKGFAMHLQHAEYKTIQEPECVPSGNEGLIPNFNAVVAFNSLSPQERLLTRTFWSALENCTIGTSNLHITPEWSADPTLATDFAEPTLGKEGYRRVSKGFLWSVIYSGERTLRLLRDLNTHVTPADHTQENPLGSISTEPATEMRALNNDTYRLPFGELALRPRGDIPQHRELRGLDVFSIPDHLAGTDRTSALDLAINTEETSSSELPEQELGNWDDEPQAPEVPHDDDFDPSNSASPPRWMDEDWNYESFPSTENQTNPIPIPDHQPIPSNQPEPSATIPNEDPPAYSAEPPPPRFFNLNTFFKEAKSHIDTIANIKLAFTDSLSRPEPYELKRLNTLVSLDEPEFKYLPLWAEGCDDDSGGVFNDDVAIPDVSFATAGPSIQHGAGMHTVSECDTVSLDGVPRGIATPGSSVASSEYHLVHLQNGTGGASNSSVAATSALHPSSNHTTAGYSGSTFDDTDYDRADSAVDDDDNGDDAASVATGSFSLVARWDDGCMSAEEEVARATREVEAMERAEAEKERVVRGEGDENYADLWGGDMEEDDDSEGEGSVDTVMVDEGDVDEV